MVNTDRQKLEQEFCARLPDESLQRCVDVGFDALRLFQQRDAAVLAAVKTEKEDSLHG